jgi:protein-S-isoprenylcysteine O-methyltransferase Ste14
MISETNSLGFSLIFVIFYIAILILILIKKAFVKNKTALGSLALLIHWIPTATLLLFLYYIQITKGIVIRNMNLFLFPILGAILLSLGIFLYFYSHIFLAKNWAATVTLQENHTLTKTGPYKYVRNPMYSALLLATVGLGFLLQNYWFFITSLFALICFIVVIKSEETILSEHFNEYENYKANSKMLIPFIL